jgi:DNA-binding transcriptional regulator LsrR (DeoR family)
MAVSSSQEKLRGKAGNGEAEPRLDQLVKIARLYHMGDVGQRQIAERLNLSTASVSRALARAKELGIVRITIDEAPVASYAELEIAVEQRFGLRECLLVGRSEQLEQTYSALAGQIGALLPRVLKPGNTLGLSWGETLKAVGENLPPIPAVHADVVPIIGAMGKIETGVYPNSIARTFAEKLKGNAYLVNTPAIVDNPMIRSSIMADSNFEQVRRLWRRLTAVILGVSSLDTDTSVYRGGIFSRGDLAAMRSRGGVCATNFIILDREGRPVSTPLSERIVCLTVSEMKEIRNVVIVAAGDNKVEPLSAVLKGAFAHVLVTDVACARALLESASPTNRSA